jgi:predicted HAD superfamily Cof-like phosphohydrolase
VDDHQKRVKEFMEKAGQTVRSSPSEPESQEKLRCSRLVLEEALETIRGLGVEVFLGGNKIESDKIEFKDTGEFDILEVADGCADISVVTMGVANTCGIDMSEIIRIVDGANLRKFGPGGYRNEFGKWIKPSDWVSPETDIHTELAKQSLAPNLGE